MASSRSLNQFYLALWGIVLAAAVVISCGKMEDRYLKGRTFFADPVGYLEESIFLSSLLLKEGRLAALRSELREGGTL